MSKDKDSANVLQDEEVQDTGVIAARNAQQRPESTQEATPITFKLSNSVLTRIDALTEYLKTHSVLGQLGTVSRGLAINLLILVGLKIMERRISKNQPIQIESIMMSNEE